MPRISVALCTYNGDAYLEDQLGSILRQTHPVDELWIFDDHSTDQTSGILSRLKAEYPDVIRVTYNRINLGARKNFEAALQACTGDYIFLSDQDDRWHPDKVETFLSEFNRCPNCLALFSDGDLMDEGGNRLPGTIWERQGYDPTRPEAADLHHFLIYTWNVVTGSALALRKEALPYILPFRLTDHFWHDEWIGFRLSAEGRICPLRQTTYAYRLHPGQATGLDVGGAFGRGRSGRNWRSADQEALMHRFVTEWLAYDKIRLLSREGGFAGSLAEAGARYRNSKLAYLNALPWLRKKVQLAKWFLYGEFQTSWHEVVFL